MSQSRTQTTFAPPVMEARRWLETADFSKQPLINVSQAAPVNPPPAEMRAAMAAMMEEDDTHLYGAVLGSDSLRTELASQWAHHFEGTVSPAQVAVTSGCNQAFSATISAICAEGDEVLLPTPWYFNHKMWLDMVGVTTVPLDTGTDLTPDVATAKALIGPRTKAIVLVTPNNPAGTEYSSETVRGFYDLAKAHGLKLLIDETYRDFDSRDGAPHTLVGLSDWDETLVQLYSFSKAYRLTGHRVGAMMASPAFLAEAEKFLDTVAICPNQLGQKAALWGLQNLGDWLAGERQEILNRSAAIAENMPALEAKGWSLLGNGAYFAYLRHPYAMPSDVFARWLVHNAQILALPGTMFRPSDDPAGAQEMRIAFANIDASGIAALFARLSTLEGLPLRA